MGTHGMVCPICESGPLGEVQGTNSVEYKGVSQAIVMLYSVCEACGSEQLSDLQSRSNKRVMIEFKKHVEGLLTGVEVKRLRERLGISQVDAANIFGGGPVAFSKYENDDVMQSEAMDNLLRLASEVPGVKEHLAARAGVKLGSRVESVGQVELNESGDKWLTAVMEKPITTLRKTVVRCQNEPLNGEDWVLCA
jgi:HTH-type transcriptional regulator/antitoxin MqsA